MADYVAGYFNTPIGYKFRKSLSKMGGVIPRMRKADLENALIILPNIEKQIRIVNAKNALEELKLLLENHEHTLWNQPYEIQTVSYPGYCLNAFCLLAGM